MQQQKLTQLLQRITADDARVQRTSIAQKFELEHPAAVAALQPERKRGPGRPRTKRTLVLEQAAAADEPLQQKLRTGSYTNWFSSPYIADIMQALRRYGWSIKPALAALKRGAPDNRFERLSDSTIRGWIQKGSKDKLLPHFQQQLEAGSATARGARPAHMSVAVEDAAKHTLLRLRDAGMPVNSHVIRWTLQSIFRTHDPSLLQSLQLSQQWISCWVRSKLKWRWRARTTAAGKLPGDWEEQGVLMAKRIAAQMEMHNVSHK